jgi:hypothetical protein
MHYQLLCGVLTTLVRRLHQRRQFTSHSPHNPIVLPELAFVAWLSGGLQAIDISDPGEPRQAGWFASAPFASVGDRRSGAQRRAQQGDDVELFNRHRRTHLRRRHPRRAVRASLHRFWCVECRGHFVLEGNSNLGDALRFARVR